MASSNTIQIFIITRNRPIQLRRALDSVLGQQYQNFDIVVSDNSTNDDTRSLLLSEQYKRIKYVRRDPQFDYGIDHINAIHREATSDYYIIFHDDDEMLDNMVGDLYKAFQVNPSFVAVAGNAYIIKKGKKTTSYKREDSVIHNGNELLKKYQSSSSAAFPSYMYNRRLLSGTVHDRHNKGGMYSDVSFLFDIANLGEIMYVSTPVMKYYIHKGQDSQKLDFYKHVQLTDYLKSKGASRSVLINLRLYHIFNNAIIGYREGNMIYKKSIASLLFRYSPTNYYLKYILRNFQNIFHAKSIYSFR